MSRVETLQLGRMLGGNRFVPDVLAHHRTVFALHQALSVVRCARDLVNSLTSSLFNSFSTRRLRNSEPLSE